MPDELIQTQRQVFTVSELTRNIRFTLEENFSGIWIEGEVSGFKCHTSGHFYFSLKDEAAQIACVMFRRESQALPFKLEDGLKIVCYGRVSVYPVRGQYQFYVDRAEPLGLGALQLRFEQLKEKLFREGLFDAAHKKPVPFLPARIGVVTSIDGAALHDILNILDRRFSSAHILIYPVPVQGSTAAISIAAAIEDLNRHGFVDVLIVGRGGGSLEDLWAFNEEILARAIFSSAIPVISAVGHEIDFTIADFVADLRAPTPSAAAEMVLPLKEDLVAAIEGLKNRAVQSTLGRIKFLKQTLKAHRENRVLRDPLFSFETKCQRLDELSRNIAACIDDFVRRKKEAVAALMGKLEALGPLATLRRGFSVTTKLPEEKVVTDAATLKVGDEIKTRVAKGFFISKVTVIASEAKQSPHR